jgi:hypothetical protein
MSTKQKRVFSTEENKPNYIGPIMEFTGGDSIFKRELSDYVEINSGTNHKKACPCCLILSKLSCESNAFAKILDTNLQEPKMKKRHQNDCHNKPYFIQFIDDCVIEDEHHSITISQMYQAYRDWQKCNFPEKAWLRRDVMRVELNTKWKQEEKGVWLGVKLK